MRSQLVCLCFSERPLARDSCMYCFDHRFLISMRMVSKIRCWQKFWAADRSHRWCSSGCYGMSGRREIQRRETSRKRIREVEIWVAAWSSLDVIVSFLLWVFRSLIVFLVWIRLIIGISQSTGKWWATGYRRVQQVLKFINRTSDVVQCALALCWVLSLPVWIDLQSRWEAKGHA